jgi:hypothetical protein
MRSLARTPPNQAEDDFLALQLRGIPVTDEEARVLENQVENEMVNSNICVRQGNELFPADFCRGTVLQFEDHARDIDVVSATKFASGVQENEVVIDEGFQFVLQRSENEEVIEGNMARMITRMIFLPLLDMNAATSSKLMILPGMFRYQTAVKLFNKRTKCPGGKFETWQDVERCAEKIYLGSRPHPKMPNMSPSEWVEKWHRYVSFGFTKERLGPGTHHERMDRIATMSRLAFLFDKFRPAHESWGGWLFSHTKHKVTTFFDLASDVDLSKFQAQAKECSDPSIRSMTKADILETAQGLDVRYKDCQKHDAVFSLNLRERSAMIACIPPETLTTSKSTLLSPDTRRYGKEAPSTADSPWLDDRDSQHSDETRYQDDIPSFDCSFQDVQDRLQALQLTPSVDEDAPEMPPARGILSVFQCCSSPRVLRMVGVMLCGLDEQCKSPEKSELKSSGTTADDTVETTNC